MSEQKTIKVKLNEDTCRQLTVLCGMNGLTVGQLIENFIRDLTGINSNGSDEHMYANAWFDRCNFFAEDSLLSDLLERDYSTIEEFIDTLDEIMYVEQEIVDISEHPENYTQDDILLMRNELSYLQNIYKDMTDSYMDQHPNANLEKETEAVKKWYAESISFQRE